MARQLLGHLHGPAVPLLAALGNAPAGKVAVGKGHLGKSAPGLGRPVIAAREERGDSRVTSRRETTAATPETPSPEHCLLLRPLDPRLGQASGMQHPQQEAGLRGRLFRREILVVLIGLQRAELGDCEAHIPGLQGGKRVSWRVRQGVSVKATPAQYCQPTSISPKYRPSSASSRASSHGFFSSVSLDPPLSTELNEKLVDISKTAHRRCSRLAKRILRAQLFWGLLEEGK